MTAEGVTIHKQCDVLNGYLDHARQLTSALLVTTEAEDPPHAVNHGDAPDNDLPLKGRRALTEDQEAAIAVLYENGHSLRDIGNRVHLHPQEVSRILDDYEVPRRPPIGKKLSPEQQALLIARYRQGEPSNLLARDLGIAVSTATRYLKVAGVSMRGDCFSPTFDQDVFKRLHEPDVQYWLGYLASPRSEVSELEGGDCWFRVRVPFSHEDHLRLFRRLLLAPQDKTRLVRSWETIGGVVLRVQSRPLVEQLQKVGIVPDVSKRRCMVEQLFWSKHYWRGLVDAVGTIDPGKVSVKAGPLLSIQFHKFVRSHLPGTMSFVNEGWISWKGETASAVLRLLYEEVGIALPSHKEAAMRESSIPPPSASRAEQLVSAVGSDVTEVP